MITRLVIKNYRSIKDLEIKLGKINAFIGPNNSGKSNIIRAINLILGEPYPTVKSFDITDFYNNDPSNPIEIMVYFDNDFSPDNKVKGFYLKYDGSECEYLVIDSNDTFSRKVSNDMRERVSAMYLSLNRLASEQLRYSQWVLYGKLLKYLNTKIPSEKKENFIKIVKNSYKTELYPHIEHLENILKEFIKKQTGFELAFELFLIDPIEIIKNLRPYFIINEIGIDPENMGAGTQSALSIAIAKAYTEIVKKSLILLIEEPELYLHPHGCRTFYRFLKELTRENIQIIYTTHERSFVNISEYQNIHLVRNEDGETKVCSGNSFSISEIEKTRVVSKFNEYINEIFFAEHVILVEGFCDKIACRLALEKLNIDVDAKNISIIDCGGDGEIKPIAEILKNFSIKTYILIDKKTKVNIEELKRIVGEKFIFIQNPDLEGMLGREKLNLKEGEKLTKEKAIYILPQYFEKEEIPEIYRQLITILEEA